MTDDKPSPPTTTDADTTPSAVEIIKDNSDYLRGGIADGLADDTSGAIADNDTALVKFHGIYQQDDRDHRDERARRKLEPDYSFMIRLRVPGGLLNAGQWLAVDDAAAALSEAGSIRLTTRQTLQFHGVPKENLRPLLAACAKRLLDSIAACGDVNRNVMCSPHGGLSAAHAECHKAAGEISARLLPKSRAYYEIWLGEERLAGGTGDEPLYGKHYLPRKFKIGIAVPPNNDIDIYSQDIGFAAIIKRDRLIGFNIIAGGGLGMTQGDARTYPRLGDEIGFCPSKHVADVAWHIAAWQRDNGDRSERKQARLKYTIARRGVEAFRNELQKRLGFALTESRPLQWTQRADMLGWHKRRDSLWDVGLFIENGRIAAQSPLRTALNAIAKLDVCHFMMTPNQNLLLIDIAEKNRPALAKILADNDIDATHLALTPLRENSMACVAMPTCPLAMAESERYLPALLDRLQTELAHHGLEKESISIRMTGCPNGCARPYLGEIGLVGKAPGRYNLFLGASSTGTRLSVLARENLNEEMLIAVLTPLFGAFADERQPDESFGDYLLRSGRIPDDAVADRFHTAVLAGDAD